MDQTVLAANEPNLLSLGASWASSGMYRLWFYRGKPRSPRVLERPRWILQDVADIHVACKLAEELAERSKQGKNFDGVLVVNDKGEYVLSATVQVVINPARLLGAVRQKEIS